ncbi:hypothetical protein JHJ32_05095 [Parapedobacter sp. ISTM3]|uniref:Outer membrane protein beta-barrel domain-containing protein n=1 Tax=Parapedobacter luteus TaxID=623280 RepID=A0A1T5BPV1_9SPHI|nr:MULTISPECIES: hypothetical protein [Parapedobacter]MBK1439356.1 hypothetical protein [Parapedobacter sp. ISTM3]SKB49231.1 hypothetical protein SAMN05660226_01640 [Parapedobacter luteus]
MKIRLLLSALFSVCVMTSFAQSEYNQSVGLRFGAGHYDWIAASYKMFIARPAAVEFNLGFSGADRRWGGNDWNWSSLALSGTYQYHFDIPEVPGLKWFVGGGLSLYTAFSDLDDFQGFGVGIYPTGGADYKFDNIPLNLSADLRPTIYIDGLKQRGNFFPNLGIAARYTF